MAAQEKLITSINFERFEVAFKSPDDVGAVVRCEYEIERAAYRALKAIFPKYDLMRHRYLSDHLKTFRAFGCEGPIFQVADCVRKIRNKFAHEGQEIITDQDILELNSQAGTAFGNKHLKDWIIGAGMWGIEVETKWSGLSNRQRFVLTSSLGAASLDTLPQRIPRIVRLDHLPKI